MNGTDESIELGKVGGSDPTGDLTCDGGVTNADVVALRAHLGHTCSGIVGTRPGTWGKLKTIFR